MSLLGILFSPGYGHLKYFCKNKLLDELLNFTWYFYLILNFLKLNLDI